MDGLLDDIDKIGGVKILLLNLGSQNIEIRRNAALSLSIKCYDNKDFCLRVLDLDLEYLRSFAVALNDITDSEIIEHVVCCLESLMVAVVQSRGGNGAESTGVVSVRVASQKLVASGVALQLCRQLPELQSVALYPSVLYVLSKALRVSSELRSQVYKTGLLSFIVSLASFIMGESGKTAVKWNILLSDFSGQNPRLLGLAIDALSFAVQRNRENSKELAALGGLQLFLIAIVAANGSMKPAMKSHSTCPISVEVALEATRGLAMATQFSGEAAVKLCSITVRGHHKALSILSALCGSNSVQAQRFALSALGNVMHQLFCSRKLRCAKWGEERQASSSKCGLGVETEMCHIRRSRDSDSEGYEKSDEKLDDRGGATESANLLNSNTKAVIGGLGSKVFWGAQDARGGTSAHRHKAAIIASNALAKDGRLPINSINSGSIFCRQSGIIGGQEKLASIKTDKFGRERHLRMREDIKDTSLITQKIQRLGLESYKNNPSLSAPDQESALVVAHDYQNDDIATSVGTMDEDIEADLIQVRSAAVAELGRCGTLRLVIWLLAHSDAAVRDAARNALDAIMYCTDEPGGFLDTMVVALVEQGCLSLLLQLFGASARQSNKQRHDHQVSELPSTEVIMAPFLSNAANHGVASGIQHICDPSETQVPPRTLPESQIHSSVVSCPVAVVLVLRESARVANRVIGWLVLRLSSCSLRRYDRPESYPQSLGRLHGPEVSGASGTVDIPLVLTTLCNELCNISGNEILRCNIASALCYMCELDRCDSVRWMMLRPGGGLNALLSLLPNTLSPCSRSTVISVLTEAVSLQCDRINTTNWDSASSKVLCCGEDEEEEFSAVAHAVFSSNVSSARICAAKLPTLNSILEHRVETPWMTTVMAAAARSREILFLRSRIKIPAGALLGRESYPDDRWKSWKKLSGSIWTHTRNFPSATAQLPLALLSCSVSSEGPKGGSVLVVPVHCELLCAASSELQRVIELHESQKPDLELFSLPLHSISIQLSLAPHLPAVNIAIQSAASAVTPITPCMNDSLTSFDEDSGDAILLLLILYLYEPELWDKALSCAPFSVLFNSFLLGARLRLEGFHYDIGNRLASPDLDRLGPATAVKLLKAALPLENLEGKLENQVATQEEATATSKYSNTHRLSHPLLANAASLCLLQHFEILSTSPLEPEWLLNENIYRPTSGSWVDELCGLLKRYFEFWWAFDT